MRSVPMRFPMRFSGRDCGIALSLILAIGCNRAPNVDTKSIDRPKAEQVAKPDDAPSPTNTLPVEPIEPNERSESAKQRVTLSVSFPGIVAGKGDLRIAVYGDAGSFNKPDKALMKEIFTLSSDRWEAQLDSTLLKDNRLAIAVYLDTNANGVLDKNTFGIPTELYGFSKNPKRGFGPPRFEEAAVTKDSEVIELEIQLH